MKRWILLILIVLIHWPLSLAMSSVPQKPIFEYEGDGQLEFFNTHTNELMEIDYKNEDGEYIEDGLDDVKYILRCRLTDEVIAFDLQLIELVDYIQDHFGGKKIEIISGYRSPELNSALRSRGRGVASRSYHLSGKAVDIRIPGVSTREIRDYAISLKAGGVGYYSGPDFVHIDVGPVRRW